VNCFQVVRSVLDELYAQICSFYGQKTDQVIRQEIIDLSAKMRKLHISNEIDYCNPVTRFAYIYCYTTAHADLVYQLIRDESELRDVFDADTINVSCMGGGPGSDFLGILKFLTLEAPQNVRKLACLLCDRERSWREAWCDVDKKLSSSFSTSTVFWEEDVTDTSRLSPQTKLFQADLFTMIYFISELSDGIEDARDFFDIMIQGAKPGAVFLLVDNNSHSFYDWFDQFAVGANLQCLKKREDYYFKMGWDEQADELAVYNTNFKRTPKITARIAYRIYRKP
jgi:hypothetical protein